MSEFSEAMFEYCANSKEPVVFEMHPPKPGENIKWVGRLGSQSIEAPDGITIMKWALGISRKR